MQRIVTGPSIAERIQRERQQWSVGGRGWMGKPRPFTQSGAAPIDDPAMGPETPAGDADQRDGRRGSAGSAALFRSTARTGPIVGDS